jgi:hypothetical protein
MVKLDTGSRVEQRKFGLLMAGAFCLLGLLRWAIHHFDVFPVKFFVVAVVFGVLGLAAPRVLQPVFVVWMKFAEVLNWVMTRVFLTVTWYLILTPTSLVMRLGRKEDAMKRAWLPAEATYWEEAEEMGEGVESFKNQF